MESLFGRSAGFASGHQIDDFCDADALFVAPYCRVVVLHAFGEIARDAAGHDVFHPSGAAQVVERSANATLRESVAQPDFLRDDGKRLVEHGGCSKAADARRARRLEPTSSVLPQGMSPIRKRRNRQRPRSRPLAARIPVELPSSPLAISKASRWPWLGRSDRPRPADPYPLSSVQRISKTQGLEA